MTENINNTKNNYKKIDDIASEIRHSEIEDFLEFYNGDKYKFLKCEMCNGIEVKCRSLDGARYDKEIVESLQNWMKRNKTFQQAVTERNKKNKNEEQEKMSETIKTMMESMEIRNQTQTTQLIKSRPPPIWSGQNFEKWRIEIERWFENTFLS